jgi:2-polyprenyl-3-methyl-5-hydroxy-6-metoxy-1,4-benzoquinol methylase
MNFYPAPRICRACGSSILNSSGHAVNGFIEGSLYEYVICSKCKTHQTSIDANSTASEIYDAIYNNANLISGYKRYSLYANLSKGRFTSRIFKVQCVERIYAGAQELINRTRLIKGLKSPKVLEIGSSLGYFTASLRRQGCTAFGLDLSQNACDEANRLHDGGFVCGSPAQVEISCGGNFDVIVILEVLEHLENPFDFLCELKRLLKPGGSIIISCPNCAVQEVWNTTEPPVHVTFFTMAGMHLFAQRLNARVEFLSYKSRFGPTKHSSIARSLPGAVLLENLEINKNYFDNGPISKIQLIKCLAKSLLGKIIYGGALKAEILDGIFVEKPSDNTIIARLVF